ncbi:hypothetical protein [Actinoplanes sp. NPDC026670]|uniref:hypothetical protein n=1 Tax=Actinoplanes sp. NPDC026670 TaxID=3154700 RepID=UPI0033F80DBB
MKAQDVSPEAVADLSERGLITARLNGEDIALTPGLIKTHGRQTFLTLSRAGDAQRWDDPHRVLRTLGHAHYGLSLSFLLGMIFIDDVALLAREGLIHALTEHDTVDLGDARQPFNGSQKLILPGGAEVWISAVIVRTTRTGQLYCER